MSPDVAKLTFEQGTLRLDLTDGRVVTLTGVYLDSYRLDTPIVTSPDDPPPDYQLGLLYRFSRWTTCRVNDQLVDDIMRYLRLIVEYPR